MLAVIVAVPVIGMTIIAPAITIIKNDLNISFADTQLILTLYFTFLALGQILSGPFSDKYGRKTILLLGASIYSISAFFASLSSNIEILFVINIKMIFVFVHEYVCLKSVKQLDQIKCL